MEHDAWITVKLGGSLFDLPDLRQRLRAWLLQLGAGNVLLVPGGGATVDAVRFFDLTHQLGEEASHWLALRALSLNARILQEILPEARIVAEITKASASASDSSLPRWNILDPFPFFQADEHRADHLPHVWQVTSDSLAVRAAILTNSHELILLKSTVWQSENWAQAARAGIVDNYFAQALQRAPASLRVRLINLRVSSEPEA